MVSENDSVYERRQLKAVPTRPTPSRCKPSQLLSYNLVFNGQSDNSVGYVRVKHNLKTPNKSIKHPEKNRLISSVLVLGFKLPANRTDSPQTTESLVRRTTVKGHDNNIGSVAGSTV